MRVGRTKEHDIAKYAIWPLEYVCGGPKEPGPPAGAGRAPREK